jgi:hypothetical protein
MRIRRAVGLGTAALVAALSFAAAVSAPTPAEARVFVGFGFGIPIGFPYYYPPYPYPYPYPPLGYYPPPYYSAPVSYPPPPASYPPTSYPQGAQTPVQQNPAPAITYTPRPGWTNAHGEYCREYRTSQGTGSRATERFGTACRDASGQWRIVN